MKIYDWTTKCWVAIKGKKKSKANERFNEMHNKLEKDIAAHEREEDLQLDIERKDRLVVKLKEAIEGLKRDYKSKCGYIGILKIELAEYEEEYEEAAQEMGG